MKKILFINCSLFLLYTISSISWALPPCSDNSEVWDNCFGTYEWTSGDNKGDNYVGEWKDNQKYGHGTYTWANGDEYVGEHKDDKRHGEGIYTFASGSKYIGEYKYGIRHGQFVVSYPNGDKYIGEFKNGKKNGQGTYTWGEGSNKGDKYIGGYLNGKMGGQGTYFWADGRMDVGEYKDDQLNGYAIMYDADGSIIQEGVFKDSVFQYAQKKSPNNSNSNSKLTKYKQFCEEIGFNPGTEKFADCVLEAMKKD